MIRLGLRMARRSHSRKRQAFIWSRTVWCHCNCGRRIRILVNSNPSCTPFLMHENCLALEMLRSCDRSPPEVQGAYSLVSSTLQSDVDIERDRDLDAVSHRANNDASQ